MNDLIVQGNRGGWKVKVKAYKRVTYGKTVKVRSHYRGIVR